MQRTIAVVMMIDMVGSTDLLVALGTERAAEVREAAARTVREQVAEHDGTVVDQVGDGAMALFCSAVNATVAAAEIQRAAADHAMRADAPAGFSLRIGLAVGELSHDGERYYGQAIVEAARLEPLSQPDSALATDLVVSLAGSDLDQLTYEPSGCRHLKGIPLPVETFELRDLRSRSGPLPLPAALASGAATNLVGRQSEMSHLSAAWDDALGGTGRVCLVGGEPGIGKTTLLSHLASEAHRAGALVLFGASDRELSIPYRAVAEALQDGGSLDTELGDVLRFGKGDLAPLFPMLATDPVDDLSEMDRLVLFDAVAGVLGRLADARPVLIVLDDLHWATTPTARLLDHLIDHLVDSRILIVGSYRPGEIEPGHPLGPILDRRHRGETVSTVEMGTLDARSIVQLITDRADPAADADLTNLAERIRESSGGNPFFAQELVRGLRADGALVQSATGWQPAHKVPDLPVPDAISAAIGARITAISGAFAETMLVAAVTGTQFDAEVLAMASDQELFDVLEHLDTAAHQGLVAEGDRPGVNRFVHDIVRSAVTSDLGASRRAMLHERIATAFEALEPQASDQLAHHWARSASRQARCKAVPHLDVSAQRDAGALAWESAVSRFSEILELTAELGSLMGTDAAAIEADARLGLALAKRSLGDAAFLDRMGEAHAGAERAGRSDLMARAALGSLRPGAWYPEAGVVYDDVVDRFRSALGAVSPEDPVRVRLLAGLSTALSCGPAVEERRALLDEARMLAERCDDDQLRAAVLVAEYFDTHQPELVARRAELVEDLGHVVADGDADAAFTHHFLRFVCALEAGQIAEAWRLLDTIDPLLESTRNYWFKRQVTTSRITLRLLACEPDLAPVIDEHLAEAEGQPIDSDGVWMVHHGALARIEGRLGELVGALAATAEGDLDTWPFAIAAAQIEAGDPEGATATIDGLGDLSELTRDEYWLGSMAGLGMIGLGLGRRDLCEQTIEFLDPFRGRVGFVGTVSLFTDLVHLALGKAYLGLGRLDEAADAFMDGISQADEIGAPMWSAEGRRLLAVTRYEQGRPNDARQLAIDAIELGERHGLAAELERARDLLSS